MKKLLRVLVSGMIISLLMLSGCKKVADTESTQTPENVVSDENVKENQEAEEKAESLEEQNDVTDDETKAGDDEDLNEDVADDAEPAEETENAEPTSLNDIYNEITESVDLPEMYFADADFLLNYYGIDASKLDDYIFASCLDSTSADSIILIRLKDESSADEIVGGLNMVLEEMGIEFENYNPEANELIKAAEVRCNGKNIDLIIHEDRSKILSIIDSSL